MFRKKKNPATTMPRDLDDDADKINEKEFFSKVQSFWKHKLKGGRPRAFKSPEQLLKSCLEYFELCDANPLAEHDFVGREGKSVMKNKMRAYTWAGLENFLGITDEGLMNYRKNEKYKEFFGVIAYVERIMWDQKFTGAAAGLLNPNIIARDLGLMDKTETKHVVNTSSIESFKIGDRVITFGNSKVE